MKHSKYPYMEFNKTLFFLVTFIIFKTSFIRQWSSEGIYLKVMSQLTSSLVCCQDSKVMIRNLLSSVFNTT